MTDLTLAQQQETQALVAKQITQDKAQAYEMLGMVKMSDFTRKLVTVSHIKVLAEFKESKKYKGLDIQDINGNWLHVTKWEEFCNALGYSREKIDTDILNLSTFGETFLETSQRLGLGYRDLRKLRKLPEDARAEIVDAEFSESADKEELLEKIEELTAKHVHEKQVLEGQLKKAKRTMKRKARC